MTFEDLITVFTVASFASAALLLVIYLYIRGGKKR